MTTVIQSWIQDLSFMMQSVLMSATRAADGLPKNHVSKMLLRWYRRCVFYSAFESKLAGQPVVLSRPWTLGGGSFTGPSINIPDLPSNEAAGWRAFDEVVNEYLTSVDSIPHHFHTHLFHGTQVIGYEHPDPILRSWWHRFYLRCANDMHLLPEPFLDMRLRLGDVEEDWRAAEYPTRAEKPRLSSGVVAGGRETMDRVRRSASIAELRATALSGSAGGRDLTAVTPLPTDDHMTVAATDKVIAGLDALHADACDVLNCPTAMDRVARRIYDVTSTPEHPLTKRGLSRGYYQLCATHRADLGRGVVGFIRAPRPITDDKYDAPCVSTAQTPKMESEVGKTTPSAEAVARAHAEIDAEDHTYLERCYATASRQTASMPLPSEHPDHTCGLHCDGQDGSNSRCARLRSRLFHD